MTLIKTSFLSAIAVVIKMITLLSLNKILAIYVGPSGYAALGQFQSAIQMITTLASGAINTGVTKYTAEYHEDEVRQHAIWRTASAMSLCGSLAMAIVLIIFRKPLASWFLKNESLSSVFIWFAVTLVLFVFNTLLLAILNGKKEIHRYVIANIAGSIFSLLVTTIMAIQLGLYGALLALALYQSLSIFVTIFLCRNANWFKFGYLMGGVERKAALDLAKFSAMALTSAACVPLSQILIRNHLSETLGMAAAGYWEAMWRLSAAYLLLITTTLSVYYLPKLAELKNASSIRQEILQGYKIILPVSAILGLGIYICRDFIIQILFTGEFSGMEVLFGWQLVGDTLKVSSLLLGYVLTAKAILSLYVISEILFSLIFVVLVYVFTSLIGLEGASWAHALTYLLHLIFMYISLKIKNII